MRYYYAFGFYIESDIIFPELISVEKKEIDCLVTIKQDIISDVMVQASRFSTTKKNAEQLYLRIPSVANFCITAGNTIRYCSTASTDQNTLRLFLLSSCMGALLQQRGYIVLHGNAISFDHQRSTVFVGDSGAGKSTMAAFYYQQGSIILADDVCAITFNAQGVPQVIPSYPQLKLWKKSADLLNIETKSLRPIRSKIEKFALPIDHQFATAPMVISDIVEIVTDQPAINVVHGSNKLDLLMRHSYRPHFLKRMMIRGIYIQRLMTLASQVTISKKKRLVIDNACAK